MILQPLKISFARLRITLLWPVILQALSIILFAALFIFTSGLWNFLISQPLPFGQEALFSLGFELKNFLANNTIKVLISFAIFFTLYFITGSGITAIRYGIIKDIIEGKPQGIFKGFFAAIPYAKTYFWKTVGMKILTFIVQAALVAFFITLFAPSATASLDIRTRLILLAILITLSFILSLAMLFRYAYLFLKTDTPLTAFYHSMTFFLNRPGYSILVLLILVIATLIRSAFQYISGIFFLLGIVLIIVYSIFLIMWQDLFLFAAFTHRLQENHAQEKH